MNPLASKSRHLAALYLKFQEQGEVGASVGFKLGGRVKDRNDNGSHWRTKSG